MTQAIDFQTDPSRYRHWRVEYDGPVARLVMDVDADAGLFEGYQLKLNSYDLGVDIELYDAVQRLRFEHPEVKVVLLTSGKDRVFCAGANIRMLAGASHVHKVNFCKFTNETRNTNEESGERAGQFYIAVVSGSCAGGGYELALATDWIILTDDSSSSVSLPEVPLLAVLPGTGGLTRVVDKRMVRRDHADVFSTLVEGIKGQRAIDWKLVDDIAPLSQFPARTAEIARELADEVEDKSGRVGVELTPLALEREDEALRYGHVTVEWGEATRQASLEIRLPDSFSTADAAAAHAEGAAWWPFALFREVDDALLQLRVNQPGLNLVTLRVVGDPEVALAMDAFLAANRDHWFVEEVVHFMKRVLKRYDMTAKSFFALADEGTAFAGSFLEFGLGADRFYVLDDEDQEVVLGISGMNGGALPMGNDLSRLESRFLGDLDQAGRVLAKQGLLPAADAAPLGLATEAMDLIDWEDEIRVHCEERASYSPDALTGMEANLRYAGPETLETKIFGRLTAWQNWIFQRPNAVGDSGALQCYGTPSRPEFDYNRT